MVWDRFVVCFWVFVLVLFLEGLRQEAQAHGSQARIQEVASTVRLYPGETMEMRRLIQEFARRHDLPEALLHRVIQRESTYRAHVRNGPHWGLMQISLPTARSMGFQGPPERLLDPRVNLEGYY